MYVNIARTSQGNFRRRVKFRERIPKEFLEKIDRFMNSSRPPPKDAAEYINKKWKLQPSIAGALSQIIDYIMRDFVMYWWIKVMDASKTRLSPLASYCGSLTGLGLHLLMCQSKTIARSNCELY